MEELLEKDKALLLYLNNLGGGEFWDSFWLYLTNKWFSIPLYALLLALCFYRLKAKRTLVILFCVGLMILCCDQLANWFKFGFERLRPCHDESLIGQIRILNCGGKFGFFSAHAANSFAVATFFHKLLSPYYKATILLFVWASLLSYSRIYLGVHFPLDILVGIFFGVVFGFLFYSFQQFAIRSLFRQ